MKRLLVPEMVFCLARIPGSGEERVIAPMQVQDILVVAKRFHPTTATDSKGRETALGL